MDDAEKKLKNLEQQIQGLKDTIDTLQKEIAPYKASSNKLTILLLSGDLDKALAAFNIATTSVAMGYEVSIYCAFWAVNLLRKKNLWTQSSYMQDLAKILMPKGSKKASLSKMHMMGIGTSFMKYLMKASQAKSLPEMMQLAKELGIKIYVCDATLAMMGISKEELMDDILMGGASCFVGDMSKTAVNLVFT